MEIKINKELYKKLIKEDIEKVEKYFPEHSLEKKHIQEVLRSSIECYYPREGNIVDSNPTNCDIFDVVYHVCPSCKSDMDEIEGYYNYFCEKCNKLW